MKYLAALVAYVIATIAVFGLVAPMLVSARSYEGVGAGGVLLLLWLFGTAFIVKRVFFKKESKA